MFSISEEDRVKSLSEYKDIILRRKHYMFVTFPMIVIVGIVIVMLLPSMFRSQGVVLIERQDVPQDFIRSTVTSYAEQQIEVIKQSILTTSVIREFVDRYGLFDGHAESMSNADLLAKFESHMEVEMMSARIVDPGGRTRIANIAFEVSYEDKSAQKAQQVANHLVNLFVDENTRARTELAEEAVNFVKDEADRIQAHVRKLEKDIAEFRSEYADSLPEMLQFNTQRIADIREQLRRNQADSSALDDQLRQLRLELSSLDRYVGNGDGGGSLQDLKAQYAAMRNRYSELHPDVVRIKEQIAALEAQKASEADGGSPTEEATNPVYRQVAFQIESAEKGAARLDSERTRLQEELEEYSQRVKQTNQVQLRYEELTRDYETNLEKYRELRDKQLEAELSQSLESENKAEKFTLLEPPLVPSEPSSPNRPLLILIIVALAGVVSVGLTLVLEMLDPGIRGVAEMTRVLGFEPLVTVPFIPSAEDIDRKKRRKKQLFFAAASGVVVLVLVIHFLITPLDDLWLNLFQGV